MMDVIAPVTHDLGDFKVRRVLPAKSRTMVGPFIFVDQFGPARLPAGQGMDVRPHPHINLATVTYLFDGAIRHRDSLGSNQVIRPGEINLMTAGNGNARPKVRDAVGAEPLSYQSDLLDPTGRTVTISFRKLFLPQRFRARSNASSTTR
jgi:hypothetical protein